MDCFHNLSFSLCQICQKTLIEAGFAEAKEIKEMEKKICKDVQKEVMKAKESPPPKVETIFEHIYAKTTEIVQEYPPFTRMPDYEK